MAASEHVLNAEKALVVKKDGAFRAAFLHDDIVEAVDFFEMAAKRIDLKDAERALQLVKLVFNPDGVRAAVSQFEAGISEVEGLVELDLEVQR